MGSWNTVHLFDVSKFYNDIIPTLRGEKGSLKNDYIDFLKLSRIGGINDLSDYDLKKLADYIEPILIVFIGAIVLVLMLAVYLPMWELTSRVKGG